MDRALYKIGHYTIEGRAPPGSCMQTHTIGRMIPYPCTVPECPGHSMSEPSLHLNLCMQAHRIVGLSIEL